MSLQNDISFLLKLNLENFKHIEKYKYNFRCPICTDSKKSKFKARGYAIPHKSKDSLFIYCHNCGYGNQFYYFLKELKERGNIDSIFFNTYIFYINEKRNENDEFIIESKKDENKIIKENRYLINVNKFKGDSIVKKYLEMRKVDKKYFDEIYFSLNFKKLINKHYLNKYKTENDSPRIVFPIINKKLLGFQGRSIYNNSYRYMNIKFDNGSDFIYKQKNINRNEIIFITEGIFDCLMIENAIAMLGSNLAENVLNEYEGCKLIFIYDNEKRNFQITQKIKKIIGKEGIGLFVWPNIKYKDLNEWAMKESKDKIRNIILKNSYFRKIEKYLYFSK